MGVPWGRFFWCHGDGSFGRFAIVCHGDGSFGRFMIVWMNDEYVCSCFGTNWNN